MGAATPVARLDDIALADQLGLGGKVVEIAADGEGAVAIGADVALDEVLRAGAREGRIIGRGDLGIGYGRQAVRTARGKQLGIAKVCGNDVGDLTAERLGLLAGSRPAAASACRARRSAAPRAGRR